MYSTVGVDHIYIPEIPVRVIPNTDFVNWCVTYPYPRVNIYVNVLRAHMDDKM